MAAAKKKSLNEIFEALDALLENMAQEDSLEKSFALYKQGVDLVKQANDSIDKIEKQVKVLDEDGILA